MKAYTDLEQSKKLAKILPIESADCYWDYDEMQKFHRISWFEDGYNKESQLMLNENNVCAWSLAALLELMPRIEHLKPFIDLSPMLDSEGVSIYYHSEDSPYIVKDNLIDACYEMIIKLHELKML